MEVREITSSKELHDFLAKVAPHTFLGTWSWGAFEEKVGHKVWRLGVYQNTDLIAVTTVAKTIARRGTFLVWHHGPIVAQEVISNLEEIIKALRDKSLEIAKKEQCHFLRVSTTLLDTPEHQTLFRKLGFRTAPTHLHQELGWLLDITKSEDELLKGMRKNTRYAIRKAEKDGVEIISSDKIEDFEKFWEIYMDTVTRQKFTPYPKKYLIAEFETFLKNKEGLLWFGKYQGEYIATAFIAYTSNSGFYHHGASTHKFPGISASELLQWEAIKEAQRRGGSTYNFWGVVPEDATKHPWQGLSRFKRGFGGFEEAYVHAQDYVIKPWYWVNFIIEKIRKIKRRV